MVMHNDFIIAGPAEDPAKIKGKSVGKDRYGLPLFFPDADKQM